MFKISNFKINKTSQILLKDSTWYKLKNLVICSSLHMIDTFNIFKLYLFWGRILWSISIYLIWSFQERLKSFVLFFIQLTTSIQNLKTNLIFKLNQKFEILMLLVIWKYNLTGARIVSPSSLRRHKLLVRIAQSWLSLTDFTR